MTKPLVLTILVYLFLNPCLLHAANKPNVLMLLVDDLKPTIGAYGDPIAHSPNLDRLCERGVRFEQAYCNEAVCAPSRNNLMTGVRSTTSGLYSLGVNFRYAMPDAVTLTQYFMKHGYFASGVGKVFHIGHGNTDDEASWSVPFQPDKVIDYVLTESTEGTMTREQAYFSNAKLGANKSLPRGAAWECADVLDTAYADGRIADEGVRRLRMAQKKSDQPFFLVLGFCKPHLPFCAPKKYWDLYDRAKLPLATYRTAPESAPAYAVKGFGELNQYKPVPQNGPLEEEMERTLIHGYYASMSYMDAQIGRVLDELDRLKLSDNTLIVLWGDHGYHLGDHGSWTKHSNYEQANRIPIVFVAPGVAKAGTATKALIETVDIYPTLCELAGLPSPMAKVPQPFDGVSQVKVLRNPTQKVRDYAYHAYPRGKQNDQPRLGRAIRSERYRLVEWRVPGAPLETADWELYDYREDPLETVNLANKRPEVMAKLKAMLAENPEAKSQVKRK